MSQHDHPHKPTGESYLVMSPGTSGFPPTIVVWWDARSAFGSLEQLFSSQLEALQGVDQYHLVEQGQARCGPRGLEARDALFRWEVNGKAIFQRRRYLHVDGTSHVLVLSFEDDTGQGRFPEGVAVLDRFDPPNELTWA